MYVDSSPAAARRSPESPRRRSACDKPTRQTTVAAVNAPAERARPGTAAARRTRVDDAIVAQWLLEQLPSDHRRAPATP